MAEIEKWITINGRHIPILKGESKTKALSNYIKGKKQARRKKMYDKYFETADKATAIAAKKLELENEMKGGNIYTDDQIYWDSHDLGQEVADMKFERKYGKNWNKNSKHDIKRWMTDEARRVNKAQKKELENYEKHIEKADKYREQGNMEKYRDEFSKAHKEELKGYEKISKEWNRKPTYKLKTDKIKKTPTSSINVDTYQYRGAHGTEPSRVRTGGSSRGNWAFQLGNETIFINDTYSNAKKKAVKEASRRGLTSIKVLS